MTSQGRPRLLYVGTLPPHHGGSALVGAQVLAGLAALGHEVDAIAPITAAALAAGDAFALRDDDVRVHRFVLPYLDVSPDTPTSDDYRRTEREGIERLVQARVRERRPDAIVIGRESFAPHVVELARAAAIPSVLLIQGATTMGILNGSYPAGASAALLEHVRSADAIVTSAEHMRRSLAELGVPGVRVVPNPVDLDRFKAAPPPEGARAELGARDGEVVVAHVSNLKALKRPFDFLDAAAMARRADDRLVFAVIGDGPLREELADAVAARGLAGAFRFLGWVEHDELPRLLNAVDVVAMPSAGEAQALVYLETAGCERTLVASDIPAAREVVDDGRTGLLFPTADVEALAAAILLAAGDPELRVRLGGEARRRVRRHSLDRVVAQYAGLLEQVAAR